MLAGVEAYLITHEYTPRIFTPGFMVPDDALGWAPAKGMQATAMEAVRSGLFHRPVGKIFDTGYTIDSNGLRIAPPYSNDDLAGSVLFFGCSYTFGVGLNDDETLPYQVGVQSDGRYRTFNFAFVAYGPSQMLAAVETGRVGRVVDTPPRYAYYMAITHHVWRAAGRVGWYPSPAALCAGRRWNSASGGVFRGPSTPGPPARAWLADRGAVGLDRRAVEQVGIMAKIPSFRCSHYRRRHTSLFSR